MAWNYSDNEYLKLYRKFVGWEWYQDVSTKVLFLHCLLRANWKPGSWHGVPYAAGQFITSLPKLSEETGLSIKQVRTALKHLKGSGEVADEGQANFRIITVKNWDRYQQKGRLSVSQTADEGQAKGSRYKKVISKEDKKYMPPAKIDIETYADLRGFKNVDVDAFMDYNESLGWKMEWHRALDQWVKNEDRKRAGNRSRNEFLNMTQRDYDFDAIERMLEDDEYTEDLERVY